MDGYNGHWLHAERKGMKEVHVSAAIIAQDGKVFCAHRPTSQGGAGWEFPGGQVEEGETAEQAVRREIGEELGVRLSTTWLLDTVTFDYPSFHLVMDCFVCALVPGQQPKLSEHDEGRWLDRDGLLTVDWLPADRKVVELLGRYWDQLFSSTHL